MTKQEIEKYAEEKAQEFKEQIIKELSEKIEQEQNDKPYLIKKGEDYRTMLYCGQIIDFNNSSDRVDEATNIIGLIARTEEELQELIKSRKMQREYELWCMEYPCDWNDAFQDKYCVVDNKINIARYTIMKIPGVVFCANKEHIQAFIDKVGKEDFKKYVLEIGLKKYWLEV